ncbi:MAG TPA: six-cysteine peptide SCIFF, partial [Firmicutes bacterium]|nr:six-cysteine peptide SCIFF [Bacillota bacterium]
MQGKHIKTVHKGRLQKSLAAGGCGRC